MIINLNGYLLDVMQVFVIYPVMFFLVLLSFALVGGFVWVCLTRGGDPVGSVVRIYGSGRRKKAFVR
jgi:hypothetical protein